MNPVLDDGDVRLYHGDCREVMAAMPPESVDAIVCDPPAGISFMGKAWDHDRGGRDAWVAWMSEVMAEGLRVLKPGGHALVWALPRTSHWTGWALESAGFEVRDRLVHLFGSGFPKSSRVNRDPRFCQCGEAARSDESTDDELQLDDRTGTDLASGDGAPPLSGAHHLTRTPSGYRVDCPPDRGSDGGPALLAGVGAPASPPLRECAPARSHSLGRGDGQDGAQGHSPSRARRTDPPSNPGSLPPGHAATSEQIGTGASTPPSQRTGSGSASPPPRNGHTNESLSTLSQCRACGKPDADGWGTALKPAAEDWWLARKPFPGTVAGNVLHHGTGALNIDATRVATGDDLNGGTYSGAKRRSGKYTSTDTEEGAVPLSRLNNGIGEYEQPAGRWPANVVLDEVVAAALDEQVGERTSGMMRAGTKLKGERRTFSNDAAAGYETTSDTYGDTGGPSRFFATFPACGDESRRAAHTSDGESPAAARSDLSESTVGSGSRHTDLSLTGPTSTTETETRSTTTSPTSNSSSAGGTRPTTGESAPIESSAMASADAGGATNGRLSGSSTNGPTPPDRATAGSARGPTSASGEPATAPSTPPTCAPIDSGSPANRFFYTAKASTAERDGATHPTVKPLALMRWLVRLVTPPGGVCLDPFAGSGTTLLAARAEGFHAIGIEREEEYTAMCAHRLRQLTLLGGAA